MTKPTAMRAKEADTPSRPRCLVCGTDDRRMLVSGALPDGTATVLCASHELVRQRAAGPIDTLEALKRECAERRAPSERRLAAEVDELAMSLTRAFTTEKRAGADRRR